MYMLAEWQTPSHGVNQAVIWSHIAETARASQLHLPNLHVQYPYTLTDRGRPNGAAHAVNCLQPCLCQLLAHT